MGICELCSNEKQTFEVCQVCGFCFKKYLVTDFGKLRFYHRQLKNRGHWSEDIVFKKKLLTLQKCSIRELANQLKLSKSLVHFHIKLAEGLKEFPELRNFSNYDAASRYLKEAHSGMLSVRKLPENEQIVQEYLHENWKYTPFGEHWDLVTKGAQSDGHFPAGECGVIDLLARDFEGNKWLAIELKRNQGSDETVGQLLRYMGWVRKNMAGENESVHGLVIASSIDNNLKLSLQCVPNTSIILYRIYEDRWSFMDPSEAVIRDYLPQLPLECQVVLKKHLEQKLNKGILVPS